MDDYISKPIRPEALGRPAGAIATTPRTRRRRAPGDGADDRGRVLVVDDTAFNRRLLVRLLTSIGHEALEAGDGARPWRSCATRRPAAVDVILLDIVMPEMDGYETLEALKADAALRDLPVIVISGVDELESVVRCIRMGATDYLPKTVDPEILRARIEASLAQKRLRDLERATFDQQGAVNEVLRILTRSAFDLQVVLDSLIAAATRLCGADYGVAYVLDEGVYRVVASAGGPPSSTRTSAAIRSRPAGTPWWAASR